MSEPEIHDSDGQENKESMSWIQKTAAGCRWICTKTLKVSFWLLIVLVLIGIWEFSLASFSQKAPQESELTWASILGGRKARARMMADILISVRLFDVGTHTEKEKKDLTCYRLIQAGWTSRLFENANKKMPESLKQLKSRFELLSLVDPFTGQSMRFHKDESRVQIYSKGGNTRDETHPDKPGSGYENEPSYVIENTTNDDIHMTLGLPE